MNADRTQPRDTRGEVLMATMLGGALLLIGLVAVLAVIGGWLLLGLVVAGLLVCAGVVVLVVLRLLEEDGEIRAGALEASFPAPAVATVPAGPVTLGGGQVIATA